MTRMCGDTVMTFCMVNVDDSKGGLSDPYKVNVHLQIIVS